MRAAAKVRPLKEPLEIITLPFSNQPKDDEVTIKVQSVGICGTDLSIYKWTETVAKEYNPTFPLIPGHEFAGTVEQVGSGVKHLQVGDKVAVNPHISCNECEFCLQGKQNICQNRPILGCHANGGLVEFINVREMNVFKLPESLPIYLGSLAEPLSVAVHALERVHDDRNQTAAIVGAGTIGLLQYLACKAAGYKKVVIFGLDHDVERFKLAESMGAYTVNLDKENAEERLLEITGKKVVDVCFEAAGTNESINLAIDLVKTTGKVALVGIAAGQTPIYTTKLVFAEKDIIGCRAYTLGTWPKTMELMERIIPELSKLVTHRLPLEQINEAIHLIEQRKCLKVIIEPNKQIESEMNADQQTTITI
jgi:2-desacetyl-2-hydroxyethyl bacteriochlorophyllide A dehydrogenase